jgi:hypothetical protein
MRRGKPAAALIWDSTVESHASAAAGIECTADS